MDFPPVPEESKSKIDEAGRLLASDTDYIGGVEHARQLLIKWRACHLLPLRAFVDDLEERVTRLGIDAIVAMRLKRLFRIRDKLLEDKTQSMRVTQMQDIGALRAIVATIDDVRRLAQDYNDRPSTVSRDIVRKDDYISNPKPSGYRSLHIVFKYKGDRPSKYDGIRIELQIRTRLQHLLASAIEISGLRTGSQIKYDDGDPALVEFFGLAGELFAREERGTPSAVLKDWSEYQLRSELIRAERETHAIQMMRESVPAISKGFAPDEEDYARDGEAMLLHLDFQKGHLRVAIYPDNELTQAMIDYANSEHQQTLEEQSTSVVFVSVRSSAVLREAYPTFFLDSTKFVEELERLTRGRTSDKSMDIE